MTTVQRVVQIVGIILIIVGVAGMIPGVGTMDMEPVLLFGMVPVNVVENAIHIGLGAWGVMAARSYAGAKNYATINGVLYLLLAALGFVDSSGFGLMPLGGNALIVHALLGVILLAVAFTGRPTTAAPATV